MNWMLVIIVFGTFPMKTDLLFDSLDDCIRAEQDVRTSTAEAFQLWAQWAEEQGVAMDAREGMMRTMGMENTATCIPHAEPAGADGD